MLACFMNLLPAARRRRTARARSTTACRPWRATRRRWRRASRSSRCRAADRPADAQALVPAVRRGARRRRGRALPRLGPARRRDRRAVADMLFAAATDHRYIQTGHVADFTNKALEALDLAGWEHAEPVLVTSLASGYASADRMEESNAWRHPVDLVAILERAFEALPAALEPAPSRRRLARPRALVAGAARRRPAGDRGRAARRAARGRTADERRGGGGLGRRAPHRPLPHAATSSATGTPALHTFTFANAVHQGLRRAPSPELLRGVFDAAMSVYLDRFLNVPRRAAARARGDGGRPGGAPRRAARAARPAAAGERGGRAGRALPRPPAASRGGCSRCSAGAAPRGPRLPHDPVRRGRLPPVRADGRPHLPGRGRALPRGARADGPAQGQTYQIAHRLHRGEKLYEEDVA